MSHDRSRHPRKSSADLAQIEREREKEDIFFFIFLEEREKNDKRTKLVTGKKKKSHDFSSFGNASDSGFLSVFSLIA